MDIKTTNAIKHFFPNPSLILVYFESIANALDAEATEITITNSIVSVGKTDTLEIVITDNGAGFVDENYDRFKTLLSPRDENHKGTGRLVFLNYFNCVEISSIWGKNKREFLFRNGIVEPAPTKELETEQGNLTKFTFTEFTKDRVKSLDDLEPNALCSK